MPTTRSDYGYFLPITTRWMDNDIYGHVNNVTYYSYFDTVANTYLIEEGKLDIHNGDTIGFVVNSQCTYHAAVTYPDKIQGALRVNRLGNSSVEYGIGIFREGETQAAAEGTFTHVFVDRDNQRPTPIPELLRAALEKLSH
ncbi:acyl-CoA thioesterase [Pseudomaricurvus alkylphenolicus]|jgi:acyl-CoA thioester hydrolase|uniref:acyl-CoA thioesterase n=1 Tax=Pseudomaricurvus alkylphenolicus TaxID=1306991 RepID=UPI00141DB035|nr:thioesterase family protein [Pseudomaricurvus alkylphenolicus]NIB44949.1 acyl-CoA thioesterase [Pseudomaricurvus alkylphenolicus]